MKSIIYCFLLIKSLFAELLNVCLYQVRWFFFKPAISAQISLLHLLCHNYFVSLLNVKKLVSTKFRCKIIKGHKSLTFRINWLSANFILCPARMDLVTAIRQYIAEMARIAGPGMKALLMDKHTVSSHGFQIKFFCLLCLLVNSRIFQFIFKQPFLHYLFSDFYIVSVLETTCRFLTRQTVLADKYGLKLSFSDGHRLVRVRPVRDDAERSVSVRTTRLGCDSRCDSIPEMCHVRAAVSRKHRTAVQRAQIAALRPVLYLLVLRFLVIWWIVLKNYAVRFLYYY